MFGIGFGTGTWVTLTWNVTNEVVPPLIALGRVTPGGVGLPVIAVIPCFNEPATNVVPFGIVSIKTIFEAVVFPLFIIGFV